MSESGKYSECIINAPKFTSQEANTVNQIHRNNRISRDIAVCALIILVSVFLHSLSLPLLYVDSGARGEYRTESGLPYLTEMDSYLYCRLTEDLAEGDISDYTLRHGRGEDPYISANATGEEGDVVMGLPILGATVYKLLSWIPGVTPYGVVFWLAPFLASLVAIPVYCFVSRRLRQLGRARYSLADSVGLSFPGIRSGRLGGLVAAMLVVTAGAFSWHTHAGFYDTDMGLALLPCTFLLCYAEAMLAKSWRARIAWGCGSGLALCALSTFWRAYYAYFCIGAAAAFCAVFALLLTLIFRKIRTDSEDSDASRENRTGGEASEAGSGSKDSVASRGNTTSEAPISLRALPGALIGLTAQVLCCLLIRGTEFFSDIAGIAGNVGGSLANGDTSFPDAGSFVSELRPTPLLAEDYGDSKLSKILGGFAAYAEGTLNKLGAWPVLIVTAVTAAFLVYWGCRIVFTKWAFGAGKTAASDSEVSGDLLITAVFLGVWLACGLFIMLKGARFVTIPVLPVSIVCGFGIGLLHLRLNAGEADETVEMDTAETVEEDAAETAEAKVAAETSEAESDEAVDAPDASESLSSSTRPPVLHNVLYIGIIALAVAGWAFAVKPEFGTIPCIVTGAVALAIGIFLFIKSRAALINMLAVTLIFSPCMACTGGSYSAIPDGSDTLQAMCDAIREQTEPDSVIASWWDYGYFYEYAARRLTLGDGGNFNSEWNYWLGQALMTENVTLTKGIFRMLTTGGLDACHLLMDRYDRNSEDYARRATEMLKTILPLTREEAYSVLTGEDAGRDRLDATAANEVLALTHPAEPRPIYLVLSEDMLHKIGAIGTFGRWDFSGNGPSIPYVRRTDTATVIKPDDSTEITFPDSNYTLYVERNTDGSFTNCSLRDANGNKRTVTMRVVPLNSSENDSPVTDEPLPRFEEEASGSFTVYMREDGPSTYRILLCDSYAADFVIIRGFMMNGSTMFYRGVAELPESNGSTSLHEVAVWELGR